MNSIRMYGAAAAVVLGAHLLWIVWVIFGAVCTRNRPLIAGFHIASVSWGIVAEVGPWPCPLTVAEQLFETEAGSDPYHGGFVIHYLDAIVYPDIPAELLMALGLMVCALNLAIYARRYCHRISA
jgi:Protein of Unknown function (DUF2784)